MPQGSGEGSTERQRFARLRREAERAHPALRPGEWYAVLPRAAGLLYDSDPPGGLWIEHLGRPRFVWAEHFRFAEGEG